MRFLLSKRRSLRLKRDSLITVLLILPTAEDCSLILIWTPSWSRRVWLASRRKRWARRATIWRCPHSAQLRQPSARRSSLQNGRNSKITLRVTCILGMSRNQLHRFLTSLKRWRNRRLLIPSHVLRAPLTRMSLNARRRPSFSSSALRCKVSPARSELLKKKLKSLLRASASST